MRYITFKPWKRGAAALEHTWQRPSWRCRACGQAWPCAPARDTLTDGADRVSLAMYMWGNLDQAVTDLPRRSAADLFDQFVGWTTTREATTREPTTREPTSEATTREPTAREATTR